MSSASPADQTSCPACGTANPAGSRFCGKCGRAYGQTTLAKGQVVAERYRILEVLGEGGMGTVYKVEHVQIGKPMAMKVLRTELAQDQDVLRRFHREAEAASKLSHPSTVHVFDFGRSEAGRMYLVMEYVDGQDLGQLIDDEGALPFERVARIFAQVAGSIANAHKAGIIHRDLKPENIMLTEGPDGEVAKVLDFGLAKIRESGRFTSLTEAGSIIGTPYYMSPEQIRGLELDGRADVYSLGAVMYNAVVGKPPFDAENPVGILTKHLTERLVPPSQRVSELPEEANRIIVKAMQKDVGERYANARALRDDLRQHLKALEFERSGIDASLSGTRAIPELESIVRKPRRWPLVVAFLFAVVAAGVGWRLLHPPVGEKEPNHDEQRANRLKAGEVISGRLGRRIDESLGDVDLYRLRLEASGAVEATVTAVPNMDIVLELLRPGQSEPLFTADRGKVGDPETIPNAPLDAGDYLLRVRERAVGGQLPTENVSDQYEVSWRLLEPEGDLETEPNDSLERAEALPAGILRRGFIGWEGDVDTYCLSEDVERVRVRVSRVEGLDLMLRVVTQSKQRSRKIDRHGVGKGETTTLIRGAKAGDLCVEVAVDPTEKDGHVADPEATYAVEFTPASGT